MALKVKKLSVQEYGVKMKAAIQASGKLSFTEATAQNLHLQQDDRFAFYQDEAKSNVMYMVANNNDEEAFKVKKSGMYYYMPTKTLFDMLEYDYKNNTYIFDIIRMAKYDEELGGTVYQMNRRLINKVTEDNDPDIPATE